MNGRATSFDIAYLAGVSQPTVSRALRGSPMVSEETRRRIEAIAQQLNHKVDKNASNPRSQHSNTLALLLFEDPTPHDSLINPFFLSMPGSITRACVQRGYDRPVSFQQLSGNWHTVMEVDAASRRFAALCGRCAPSPAAPGSYPLTLAPLDCVVCAAGAAP